MNYTYKFTRCTLAFIAVAAISSCGTTYNLPKISSTTTSRANAIFLQAKAEAPRNMVSASTGKNRFLRVARRIEPVAKAFCERELAQNKSIECNVRLEIDSQMKGRNAYFTYMEPGNKAPVIRFSVPMLQDVKSDDEVAFILGHEYGHLIGQHIVKQQQQALAGALIMGALTAYANAQSTAAGGTYDPKAVKRNMELGADIGKIAFSQTYELESDMLGTRIASAAGYNPIEGSKFFARDETVRMKTGQLSFWGTHPSNEKRIEIVIATMAEIKAAQELAKTKN